MITYHNDTKSVLSALLPAPSSEITTTASESTVYPNYHSVLLIRPVTCDRRNAASGVFVWASESLIAAGVTQTPTVSRQRARWKSRPMGGHRQQCGQQSTARFRPECVVASSINQLYADEVRLERSDRQRCGCHYLPLYLHHEFAGCCCCCFGSRSYSFFAVL